MLYLTIVDQIAVRRLQCNDIIGSIYYDNTSIMNNGKEPGSSEEDKLY